MSSAGSPKVSLLLELRNRLRAGLTSARTQLASSVSSMKAKLGELAVRHKAAFEAMKDQIPGFSNALSLLANPYVAITAAVVALGAAWLKAVKMATEWKNSMAKVNVTAQLGKKELKELSDRILDIGRRSQVDDLMQVPEAFNKILSAGLDVNTALATLEPTLKASKASFTDVGTVAAAAVSTMNSSGIMDATRVYDILFATMNKGNAEFADIANYLPKIIPGARNAGFSLEQTGGAFAYMTAQGLKAEAAATVLQNAFKALSTPEIIYGGKTKGGFKALGIQIFDTHGKMRDMVSIATDLNKVLAGLSDEQRVNKLAQIGLDQEAATGFAIMSQNVDKLKDSIDFTTNSSGQLNEAVKNSEQPMDSWKQLGNELKAVMIGIGESGSGWFGEIGKSILDVVLSIKQLYNDSMLFQDVVKGIGVVFQYAWWVATFGIKLVFNYLSWVWEKLVGVKEATFGAGDGFEKWYLQAKPYILWIYQYLEGVVKLMGNIATFDWDGVKENAKNLANGKNMDQLRNQVQAEYIEFKKKKDEKENPATLVPQGGIDENGKLINGGKPTDADKGKDKGSSVTGMQGQPRNITFNMDAMIKMGNLVSSNSEVSSMSKRELEAWLQELLRRAIANIETSYS